jgi:hypothetical protein
MHKNASEGSHSRDTASLQAAFEREGCPVCTVILENMNMAMDSWNYEGFTDVEHRQFVTRIRGFCPLHTWQLAQRNNAFQLAVIYKEVLDDILEKMDDAGRDQGYGHLEAGGDFIAGMKRLFQAEPVPAETVSHLYEHCPFCRTRDKIEQRLIGRLVEMMQFEEMQQRLHQSTGLCRLHFVLALQYTEADAQVQHHVLVESQRACLQRCLHEVQELIRKHDYHFGQEPRGEEMVSWRRAAELCAGNPGVW